MKKYLSSLSPSYESAPSPIHQATTLLADAFTSFSNEITKTNDLTHFYFSSQIEKALHDLAQRFETSPNWYPSNRSLSWNDVYNRYFKEKHSDGNLLQFYLHTASKTHHKSIDELLLPRKDFHALLDSKPSLSLSNMYSAATSWSMVGIIGVSLSIHAFTRTSFTNAARRSFTQFIYLAALKYFLPTSITPNVADPPKDPRENITKAAVMLAITHPILMDTLTPELKKQFSLLLSHPRLQKITSPSAKPLYVYHPLFIYPFKSASSALQHPNKHAIASILTKPPLTLLKDLLDPSLHTHIPQIEKTIAEQGTLTQIHLNTRLAIVKKFMEDIKQATQHNTLMAYQNLANPLDNAAFEIDLIQLLMRSKLNFLPPDYKWDTIVASRKKALSALEDTCPSLFHLLTEGPVVTLNLLNNDQENPLFNAIETNQLDTVLLHLTLFPVLFRVRDFRYGITPLGRLIQKEQDLDNQDQQIDPAQKRRRSYSNMSETDLPPVNRALLRFIILYALIHTPDTLSIPDRDRHMSPIDELRTTPSLLRYIHDQGKKDTLDDLNKVLVITPYTPNLQTEHPLFTPHFSLDSYPYRIDKMLTQSPEELLKTILIHILSESSSDINKTLSAISDVTENQNQLTTAHLENRATLVNTFLDHLRQATKDNSLLPYQNLTDPLEDPHFQTDLYQLLIRYRFNFLPTDIHWPTVVATRKKNLAGLESKSPFLFHLLCEGPVVTLNLTNTDQKNPLFAAIHRHDMDTALLCFLVYPILFKIRDFKDGATAITFLIHKAIEENQLATQHKETLSEKRPRGNSISFSEYDATEVPPTENQLTAIAPAKRKPSLSLPGDDQTPTVSYRDKLYFLVLFTLIHNPALFTIPDTKRRLSPVLDLIKCGPLWNYIWCNSPFETKLFLCTKCTEKSPIKGENGFMKAIIYNNIEAAVTLLRFGTDNTLPMDFIFDQNLIRYDEHNAITGGDSLFTLCTHPTYYNTTFLMDIITRSMKINAKKTAEALVTPNANGESVIHTLYEKIKETPVNATDINAFKKSMCCIMDSPDAMDRLPADIRSHWNQVQDIILTRFTHRDYPLIKLGLKWIPEHTIDRLCRSTIHYDTHTKSTLTTPALLDQAIDRITHWTLHEDLTGYQQFIFNCLKLIQQKLTIDATKTSKRDLLSIKAATTPDTLASLWHTFINALVTSLAKQLKHDKVDNTLFFDILNYGKTHFKDETIRAITLNADTLYTSFQELQHTILDTITSLEDEKKEVETSLKGYPTQDSIRAQKTALSEIQKQLSTEYSKLSHIQQRVLATLSAYSPKLKNLLQKNKSMDGTT